MQELSDALIDVGERMGETPAEEYTMMLEVMMVDHPGQPHSPVFSWNAGMVMHVRKSDPVLRAGTCANRWPRGLGQDAMHAAQTHVEEAFPEWISCSAHFTISLLPLMEVWQ